MDHLVRATCNLHLISAQTSQEGRKCTNAKEHLAMSLLTQYILYCKLEDVLFSKGTFTVESKLASTD